MSFSRIAIALVLLSVFLPQQRVALAQTYPGQMGINLSTRRGVFVDMGKSLRQFTVVGTGTNATMDSSGWPTQDAATCVIDTRAVPAWAPPIDDPAAYQPNLGGTYKCSFNGQATVSDGDSAHSAGITFANQIYNSGTNTTTFDMIFPANGTALIVIAFTNTIRTFGGATNTGITNLHVIRPGYPANTTQVFTNEVLTALQPYTVIRTMDWTGTNYGAGYYGDPGHHIIQWADRTLPTDFNVEGNSLRPGTIGVAWEYVVMLANATGKDIWINTPVGASGYSTTDTTSYIYNLAQLIKNGDTVGGVVYPGLNPGLHVYVEHSNEVWNFGFSQYTWNKLEAIDAVAGTGSLGTTKVNNDGTTDQEVWAHRRHAERQYETANIFATVFGAGSMNTTVRSVYASWTINPQSMYGDVLAWMNTSYGTPSGYTYAIAEAPYFQDTPAAGASIATILANMTASGNSIVPDTQSLRTIATNYGVKLYTYEGGPDNGGGSTTNVGNRILANRDPGMGTLVQTQLRTNFFGNGGDFFTYYNLAGGYSRYGCWGTTDDEANLTTVKVQAVYNVLGYSPTAPPVPTGLTATAGNTQVALNWTASSGATAYDVKRSTVSGSGYATVSSPTTTSYTNTGLTNGTTYYFVVDAKNANGTSANSSQASAIPVAGGGTGTIISLDFVGTGTVMGASESAGVVAATNWNNGTGAAGSGLALNNSTGSASGATAAWSCNNPYTVSITDTPGNMRMMRGYLDTGDTTTTTVTISGLPASITSVGYDVYVYCDGDNAGNARSGNYVIGGTTINATDPANVNFSGTFTQANNSAGNYVKFINLSSASFTLSATPTGLRAPVNAIQIVAHSGGGAPPVPTGLTATPGNTQVALTWNASSGATAYDVKRSTVSGSGYVTVSSPTTTSYTNTGLTNGTTYYYVVDAKNASGTSANSSQASAVPKLTVISLNFQGQNPTAMGAAESAGVVAATNWNNGTGLTGSGFALKDGTGAASGATAAWSANGTWTIGIADTAGNNRMMNGYLDATTSSTTVTISGLPSSLTSAGYDVYVYGDGDSTSGRSCNYTIGATTIGLTDNANFAGTFTQANGSAGNYVKFTNVNSASFTLTAAIVNFRAFVNAIQIVGH